MKYIARLRRVTVHEIVIEAESFKEAFSTAMKKAQKGYLVKDIAIGLFYEIESITVGGKDDYSKFKRKQNRRYPPDT